MADKTTEYIDKLFLELSQFTNAKTATELYWMKKHDKLYAAIEAIHIIACDGLSSPDSNDALLRIRGRASELL